MADRAQEVESPTTVSVIIFFNIINAKIYAKNILYMKACPDPLRHNSISISMILILNSSEQ